MQQLFGIGFVFPDDVISLFEPICTYFLFPYLHQDKYFG